MSTSNKTTGHEWFVDSGPPYVRWTKWVCSKCGDHGAGDAEPAVESDPTCEERAAERVHDS